MALENTQYDEIMRDYSRRQSENRRLLEERRQEVYRKLPDIPVLEAQIAEVSAESARRLLTQGEGSTEALRTQVASLEEEIQCLLVKGGYPADYLSMPYTCPLCQDTGYVEDGKCACFLQAESNLLYRQSQLPEILQKENFEHFSFQYYSDTMVDDSGTTPLALAKRAYETARTFVHDFPDRYANLFLYGETGVGKTFLSHCVAKEVLDAGHSVLYFSAFDLFETLAKKTFDPREGTPAADHIYTCDLLIIDDLGTELTNSFVSSALFFCINERITKRRPTVISTNLTLEQFSNTYSERTFSRIISEYQLLKLGGRDIRIQQKLTGGNLSWQ